MPKDLTLIFHSHKMLDQEVFNIYNLQQDLHFKFEDLAKVQISYCLLLELANKLDQWQHNLVDTKFLDHSIIEPEKEFLMLNKSTKLKFLHNNQWAIGTPIVFNDHEGIRFRNVIDARFWLKAERVMQEEFF